MTRLLIVEDDGDLQQILSIGLSHDGYELHYAFNGKEGHDKALSLQPDCILLDLMMPVLNGVEVLKLLMANTLTKDIPIIVMTAHGDKAAMLESSLKLQGVREYLPKPFEISDLNRMVRRLLSQYPRHSALPTEVAKGAVRLDTRFRTVWVDGRLAATLSPTKAKLFQSLVEAQGAVAREKLIATVWGSRGKAGALEKMIQRLRGDLGPDAHRIQTTAEGYELVG